MIQRLIIECGKFLEYFRDDISKKVEKDGIEHIEYIPTQIVSEYLRLKVQDSIMGIVFPSAQHEDGVNIAFFFMDNEHAKNFLRLKELQYVSDVKF